MGVIFFLSTILLVYSLNAHYSNKLCSFFSLKWTSQFTTNCTLDSQALTSLAKYKCYFQWKEKQNCSIQIEKKLPIALKLKRVWDEAHLCDWKMFVWKTPSAHNQCKSTLLNGWISVLVALFRVCNAMQRNAMQCIESILYFKVYFKEQTRKKSRFDFENGGNFTAYIVAQVRSAICSIK